MDCSIFLTSISICVLNVHILISSQFKKLEGIKKPTLLLKGSMLGPLCIYKNFNG